MAGNVWEWCLNEYDNPKQTGLSGDGRRVLRGGSWDYSPDYARAACRAHFGPAYRNLDFGVRLVCVAPILDH
jgi:formylglycine-generating enzyme required for sulfatase activity